MKTNRLIYATAIVLAIITSCKKEEPIDDTTNTTTYDNGVFIVNEGPFQTGSGTVSFYDRDKKTVSQDIFQTVNSASLGNIVQSMTIHNSKAYIVVNNASKVEVVNASTFKSSGTIDGLSSPRYFVGLNASKGYVSDWGSISGTVAVVDLSNNTVTSAIDVKGSGPENMLLAGDKLFVLNSGGWGYDSTVAIIDTQADTLLALVTVGDNPRGIALDANGKIWVLCGGIADWMDPSNDTEGKLVKLNADTYTIEQSISFSSTTYHPTDLVMNTDKNKLYYIYGGGVYEFDISSTNVSSAALFTGSFYALGYDPETDYLYAADPLDYTQNGLVYRYKADNGDLVDSLSGGVIPGDFWFE